MAVQRHHPASFLAIRGAGEAKVGNLKYKDVRTATMSMIRLTKSSFLNRPTLLVKSVCVLALGASVAIAASQRTAAPTAAAAVPLKVGSVAPDAVLRTVDGKTRHLKGILRAKPTVLIFYRGGWCPFCNRQLADIQTVEGKLQALGFQLIAISPDKPEELVKTKTAHDLTYQLFSDSKAEALRSYGVAFRVDDATFTKYRDQYHLDLERSSGETHHILPVPSVFIVDRKGKIVFVHSNPDYKVRMDGNELLAAAEAVAHKAS